MAMDFGIVIPIISNVDLFENLYLDITANLKMLNGMVQRDKGSMA